MSRVSDPPRSSTTPTSWRRRVAAAGVVLASVYGPQVAWLLMMPGTWSDYRWSWIRMIPILPGLLPASIARHRWELSETTMMILAGAISLTLVFILWLPASIGRRSRIAVVIVALIGSAFQALALHAAYRA